MPKLYRSREGEVTAVDTKTQLTTLGSETAPGPLLVPNQAKSLAGVLVAAVGNHSAINDANFFIRLEGPGLTEGPEVIAAGAEATQVATGGAAGKKAEMIPLNIPVQPSQEILVFGEMAGEDIGAAQFGVTLIFDV